MKKIGILGGLGPESTIVYYEYITRRCYEAFGSYTYPEIIIYSFNFKEFIDVGYELPDKVKMAIEKLHRAGADFVVASCNSLHIVFDEVSKNISIPWLSIIDVTAEAIKKENMKKVGLLGTIFTMSKDFYKAGLTRHGIEVGVPSLEDQKKINAIIYNELIIKEIKDSSRQLVLEIIDRLKQRGVEGIVLGCTELPFLIKQQDTDIKVFDTAMLHAEKAFFLALNKTG